MPNLCEKGENLRGERALGNFYWGGGKGKTRKGLKECDGDDDDDDL